MSACFCSVSRQFISCFFFFFNDTATTEIYTLSLHDALPIYAHIVCVATLHVGWTGAVSCTTIVRCFEGPDGRVDRKSTRLNSSHSQISYAVFCLKKKQGLNLTMRGSPFGPSGPNPKAASNLN